MKRIWSIIISTLAFGFVPQVVFAQGTIYLSNLGDSSSGGNIGGGSQNFETGGDSNGYMLNSVTLLMGGYVAIASNFNVSIFNDDNGQAGVSIGTLSGNSDPEAVGQYVYTASDIILNSTTTYWIVAACDSSSQGVLFPPGGYIWHTTLSPNYESSNGWNIDTSLDSSLPGFFQLLQFSINATPVPEPSIFGLLAFGSLLFRFRRAN